MTKTINHKIKPWLILAILLTALVIILFTWGCSPIKREERKDNAAVERVNANADLQNKVASKYLEVHPCVTTTIKDSIITKHDTITTEHKTFIPVTLTQFKTKSVDTIIDNVSVFIDSTGITVKNLNEVETVTHTVYQTKIDNTAINNLTDSLNEWKNKYNFKCGQLTALSDNSNAKDKTIAKKNWIIVALGIALGLSAFFNVKGLITKIPSAISSIVKKV